VISCIAYSLHLFWVVIFSCALHFQTLEIYVLHPDEEAMFQTHTKQMVIIEMFWKVDGIITGF
jgi:hypothetical protein